MGWIIPYIIEHKKCLKPPTSIFQCFPMIFPSPLVSFSALHLPRSMQLLPQLLSPLWRHCAQRQPQRGALAALAAAGEPQGLQEDVGEGSHQWGTHAVAKHLVQGPEPLMGNFMKLG